MLHCYGTTFNLSSKISLCVWQWRCPACVCLWSLSDNNYSRGLSLIRCTVVMARSSYERQGTSFISKVHFVFNVLMSLRLLSIICFIQICILPVHVWKKPQPYGNLYKPTRSLLPWSIEMVLLWNQFFMPQHRAWYWKKGPMSQALSSLQFTEFLLHALH